VGGVLVGDREAFGSQRSEHVGEVGGGPQHAGVGDQGEAERLVDLVVEVTAASAGTEGLTDGPARALPGRRRAATTNATNARAGTSGRAPSTQPGEPHRARNPSTLPGPGHLDSSRPWRRGTAAVLSAP
jgi:hypothetical protein